jgi:uncharacterized DUF497 family protein
VHPRNAEGFEWDEHNSGELARHRITEWEAEQVFGNGAVWSKNKKHRSGDWKMIGYTDGGRSLTVIVLWRPKERILRPITGWNCTDGERAQYLRYYPGRPGGNR